MTKVVKTRKTRSDIQPERLLARTAIASKQAMGRTRLSVEEIAREAFSKLVGDHPERMGVLALGGMKDVVRAELQRSDSTGNPVWISTGVGGAAAREYVHASVASGEALRDTMAFRQEMNKNLEEKVAKLGEILRHTMAHSCTVQDAIFALYPDAEEQEVSDIVEQLESIAA
jgi:hypothetical protein